MHKPYLNITRLATVVILHVALFVTACTYTLRSRYRTGIYVQRKFNNTTLTAAHSKMSGWLSSVGAMVLYVNKQYNQPT